MAAALPVIMAVSSAVGAGTAVAGAVKGEQARQAADNEAGRQGQQRADAERTARARLEEEKVTAEINARREQQAAVARARARTGRSGTLLTGSLGAPSQATPGKTLLGM